MQEKKKLNGQLVPAAAILGIASLGSRIVGLFRERVFATTFGAGDVFDAFVAAFRVPDLVFNLIVIGALSAAFIPLFTEKMVKGRRGHHDAFQFAQSVLNAILGPVIVLSVLYAALAPYIVPLITPGFSGEKLELTILLSRIMAVQPILLGISFVFSGILNSFKRFVVYALAPILYNVGIIVGVVWFVPLWGVAGLGWGVVLGALLHMLIQLPSAVAVGFRWQPVVKWSTRDMMVMWRMMVPRVFGLAAQQINLLVVTVLGSGLLAGSIAAFHLANNLQHLPIGIFGIAFAQAAFPTMAEQFSKKQHTSFRHTITRTFRYILFFVIPFTVFALALRAQIVRVLFGDGQFDWEDTTLTFQTFGLLAISIFAQATIPLLTRAFYVQQNTKTPVIISIVSIVINIVLAVPLSARFGVQGLALAFSAGAIVNLLLLLVTLHRELGGFDDRVVAASIFRIGGAALVAGVVVQLLKFPVAALVDMQRFWGVFTQLVVTGTAGTAVYVGVCWWLDTPEFDMLRRYWPRRLKPAPGTETPRFSGLIE